MTKYCSHCRRALPLTSFHRNKARWDGRASWCRRCMREASARWYARTHGVVYGGRGRGAPPGWPPLPRED